MLNPFPDLLIFSFFAPTLLRIAAGVALLYMAYVQYARRDEIADTHFPLIGKGAWIAYVSIFFFSIVGLMLFFGYYTQIAALGSAIVALKSFFLKRRYAALFPLSSAASLLLLVISISLLFSGAGAFAFDLPL